ncbi:MAG: diaminopimelate decarboxylase [Flavobacteriales bacterium]|nr:diaminopimelate decarboxylase [Flavobacteriales bacterium]
MELNKTFILEKACDQPTPFYLYRMDLLRATLEACKKAADKYNYKVHYALKANSDPKVLQTIGEFGFGADCVSGQEILTALENGYSASHTAFAGVGKTDDEINIGLDKDIFTFNCESVQEIEVINELAQKKGKVARIALRINPNVNANTHKYITTGLEENKFGINKWEFEKILKTLDACDHIKLTGLHFHIGSQIVDLSAYRSLCLRVNEIQQWFIERRILLEHINVGGGLGIDYYQPDLNPIIDFEGYFAIFNDFLELQPHQELHFELGRALVGTMGELITKVLYIKNGQRTNFAIVDAGMTELIRPALYQAYHKIDNISKSDTVSDVFYDVVGPICESSDCFGKRVKLPLTERGDIVAIRCAGAYGQVMANQYNLRKIPDVVYYEG